MRNYKQTEKSESGALSAALSFLARKAYTMRALEKKLEEKGFSDEEIKDAISRLCEWKYLDDGEYARRYCRDKRQTCSPRKIKYELSSRGISEDLADMAIETEYPPELELGNCERELTKALRNYLPGEDRSAVEKIWQRAYRKGYTPETIKKAWQRIAGETIETVQ